jgi:GNAT superfamily N-acetyltransferase
MPITTLRASSVDIGALVSLMREFYGEASYALDEDWAAASFSALLGDPSRGMAWIVKVDGEPAGHAVLTLRHSMEFGGLDAFVDDLFVRAKHRRRGLGRALLSALFDECSRRGVLAVHVETGADNVAARALYGSFGMIDRRRLLLTTTLSKRTESPHDTPPP